MTISKIHTFFLATIFAFIGLTMAKESPQSAGNIQTAMSAEQQQMMQMMEAASKITENHKALDYLVGEWNTTTKMWMAPNAKPEESTGKTQFESVLEGRFVREMYNGMAMGKPFQGVGYLGYDNMKKKYVTLWMDNMSTGVFMFEGESKDKGKTITSTAEFMCPLTGKPKTIRTIMKKMGSDKVLYEHFDTDPATGKEFKSLEVVYKR